APKRVPGKPPAGWSGPCLRRPRTTPSPSRPSSATATWPTATSSTWTTTTPARRRTSHPTPMSANRDQPPRQDGQQVAAGRRRARRTALIVALVAVGVYAAFILSGVLNQ